MTRKPLYDPLDPNRRLRKSYRLPGSDNYRQAVESIIDSLDSQNAKWDDPEYRLASQADGKRRITPVEAGGG